MGCFSTCFQKSNRRKPLRPRSRRPTPRLNQLLQRDQEFIGPSDFDTLQALPLTEITEGGNTEEPINPVADSVDVQREKLNISGRKKVTFDLNVKIYEGLPAEDNEPESDFLVKSINDEKGEKGRKARKEEKNQSHSDSSSSSSLFSFPPNGYRYQNCDSYDEFDQLVSDDESDLDSYLSDDDDEEDENEEEVNNDHLVEVKEESSESLFSLSIDSRKHKLSTETGDKEVNSPMPVKTLDEDEDEADKIKNLDSVLNPVENLTQWKAIKARAKLASQNKAKENKNSGQQSNIQVIEEPILKPLVNSNMVNSAKSKNSKKEIAVDTSLSTWLVGSEPASPIVSKTSSASVGNSPQSYRTCSPKDFEDCPILAALTVEEINQFSAASTPRKSPSRSPDDMPIIGTVGSYWSHTGQGTGTSSNSGSYLKGISNTGSNFRQGSKLNFNSSPTFEKRLESVL